ncbi:hypothetical protein B296_00003201, partial [Ensete ventricosum]
LPFSSFHIMATGQIFSQNTQALFYNYKQLPVQRMLDFDFLCGSIEAACAAHPTADVFINFASFRSAAASSMSALIQPTIRVVAIIAEGVPESDTKQLIAFARANNKVRNTNKFCKDFVI